MVAELRKGLGGGDPDADGKADPFPESRLQFPPDRRVGLAFDSRQVEKGLVDRIGFVHRTEPRDNFVKARGHGVVELVVRREHRDVVFLTEIPNLEVGGAPLDPERFGVLRERDDAAVVVRENAHGPVAQFRIEDPLHAGVGRIDVRVQNDAARWRKIHVRPLL